MRPEPSPESEDQELAARLSARDEDRARTRSAETHGLFDGLPPDAAERLRSALGTLERLQARWPGHQSSDLGEASLTFGKFLIEGELGRGGHGIVYLAFDTILNRRVALKIPRPELLGEPDWRHRFLREAQALARLDHPGIVAILEASEIDGICYIASTYCDGLNLAAWLRCKQQPLGPRAAARVAQRIAEAVEHAHARGVVHRDLKPRNIIMEPAPPTGDPNDPGARPRVTDFGLAKRLEDEADLTRTGMVLGTPRYMAPEQARARHDLVGPPADVYAIGAILEEMLFDHGVHRQGGEVDLPAVSVPSALRAIVDRCLQGDLSLRYPDASGLATDLARFLEGRRIRAGRFASWPMLIRARPRAAIATFCLMGLLLAAAGLLAARRHSGRPGPTITLKSESEPARRAGEPTATQQRYVDDLWLISRAAPSDVTSSTYNIPLARSLLDRYRPAGPGDDLRAWEWYHFDRMLHGGRTIPSGHRNAVYHMEYSRDGTRLASSGEDGVCVLDTKTGTVVNVLSEHEGSVNWVGFSPDGMRLATTGDDRTVRVWDANSGRRLLPPLVLEHKGVVALFTRNGRHLVVGDRGAMVTVWDAAAGDRVRSERVGDEPIEGMDLSPDGSLLAVATSHAVSLWNYPAMTRRPFRVPTEHLPARFDCVVFSHDGKRFATSGGASNSQIRIWDTRTGQLKSSYTHHADERVMTVAFSPGDRLLLSTASDEAARVWDLATDFPISMLTGHEAWVWCGAFAPDGRSVATADARGVIKLWDPRYSGAITEFRTPAWHSPALAFSADGGFIYQFTSDGSLAAWDTTGESAWRRLPFREVGPLVDAAFAPGGIQFAVVPADRSLILGSRERAEPELRLPKAVAAKPCLAFSRDGATLAYVAADGHVRTLGINGANGGPRDRGTLPSLPACLMFDREGCLIAGDSEGRLFALAAVGGAPAEAAERAHRGQVTALALAPDGRLLASGGEDGTVCVWDGRSFRLVARLQAQHNVPIKDVAFCTDGRSLISVEDRVRIWNLATRREIADLTANNSDLAKPARLAVSSDGTSIAALVMHFRPFQLIVWHAERPSSGQLGSSSPRQAMPGAMGVAYGSRN